MNQGAAARLSLVAAAILWGLNWPAAKLVLHDLSPWTFRTVSLGGGALLLVGIARWRGLSLRVASMREFGHLAVAALFNIAGFNILSAFAQLGTTTSRAAICAYTMPIWATLLARLFLGERLDPLRIGALLLGAAGLATLLWPLAATGLPAGIYLALGAGMSWAAGTVYLKWAKVTATPLSIATWQLGLGALVVALGMVFGHHDIVMHAPSAAALVYTILAGSALAYLFWFQAIQALPAGTAGLGLLLVPVVGVVSSALLLGDRPSAADIAGFVLISAAAFCVLVPRKARLQAS